MYQTDRAWGDSYQNQVLTLLKPLTMYLAEIVVASTTKDNTYATDFEVKVQAGGTIAVRLRRANCRYRDLTIRAHRMNGMKTELAKIKEGHAFRYFYGWTDESHAIAEWILVDLDKARAEGLLEKERRLIPNGDGTFFIGIPVSELRDAGCLIASQLKPDRQVSTQVPLADGIARARQKYYQPRLDL